MSSTATQSQTIQDTIDKANPGQLPAALQKVNLGTMITPLKRTFTGLAAQTSHDLTAIDGSGETAGAANPNRLPVLTPTAVRVTAGAAAAGVRFIGDTGATPAATIATLSDDGKTLTFEGNVTAFIVVYVPRALEDPGNDFLGT